MSGHKPYEDLLKRRPDFRVHYRFYSEEEGGRRSLPFQGIRSNFWYDHPEHRKGEFFMIWPEFEDERGQVILDNSVAVPITGTARMWIVNDEFISHHRGKIRLGTKGFFKEGGHSIGECEVIELLNIT